MRSQHCFFRPGVWVMKQVSGVKGPFCSKQVLWLRPWSQVGETNLKCTVPKGQIESVSNFLFLTLRWLAKNLAFQDTLFIHASTSISPHSLSQLQVLAITDRQNPPFAQTSSCFDFFRSQLNLPFSLRTHFYLTTPNWLFGPSKSFVNHSAHLDDYLYNLNLYSPPDLPILK